MTSSEWEHHVQCPVCRALLVIPMKLNLGEPNFLRDEVKVQIESDTQAAEEHVAAHTRGEDTP